MFSADTIHRIVAGMISILRKWEKSNPERFEEIMLVDKIFHFPESIPGSDENARCSEDRSERSFLLSIHGSWMLEHQITAQLETQGEWKAAAVTEAAKLRAWAEAVDPNYLSMTIQSMAELIEADQSTVVTHDSQGQVCAAADVQACDLDRLKEGNDSEFPFPLSVSGAWLLFWGIKQYARIRGTHTPSITKTPVIGCSGPEPPSRRRRSCGDGPRKSRQMTRPSSGERIA